MNVKIHIAGLIGILLIFISCNDDSENTSRSGDNEIKLSAMSLRANGDVYPNLKLMAVVAADPAVTYIPETSISVSGGLYEDTPTDITFPGGSPYYPLGNNDIRFYAFSQGLVNGRMYLVSGKGIERDYILSNQGFRASDLATLSTEGDGTPGSSTDPAQILQFRHLMTQVNIIIKVDSTETPYVDPPPTSIQFRLDGQISASGYYDITASAPVEGDEENAYTATNLNGTYTISEGINYLVPSGEDLTKLAFSYLKIDDYTATPADLNALSIDYVDGNTEALLISGYAYTITFNIRRLGVPTVTISKTNWQPSEITNEDIGYDPYRLSLDLGDYVDDGTDAITKVVLWTDSGRQYVGARNEEGTIDFVTLPATNTVDSISLYTRLGLLIEMEPDNYTYSETGSQLTAILSRVGMHLLDSSLPNSENNPYLIKTPVQIFNMGKDLTASYRLEQNIDIDRLNYTVDFPLFPLETFKGIFDGNGYQVQNLMMQGPALVRRNEGTIKNLHLAAGRINAAGENVVGSICAVNAGKLVACFNEARIVGAENIAGGICGTNEANGTIIACVNTGNIDSGVTLGGICGNNLNTNTNAYVSCINTGLMTKEATQIGGILGYSTGTINNVIMNSFWLVGTAAHEFGGAEVAVGGPNFVGVSDVAALSPEKLRESISDDQDEVLETLLLLNQGLQATEWGTDYEFILNQNTTGSVWPVPVKRN